MLEGKAPDEGSERLFHSGLLKQYWYTDDYQAAQRTYPFHSCAGHDGFKGKKVFCDPASFHLESMFSK